MIMKKNESNGCTPIHVPVSLIDHTQPLDIKCMSPKKNFEVENSKSVKEGEHPEKVINCFIFDQLILPNTVTMVTVTSIRMLFALS